MIEGLVNGKWKTMVQGKNIGHKRIHQFDAVEVKGIRLKVLESTRKPILSNLSLYYVSNL